MRHPAYPQITVTPSHSVLANRLIPPTTVSEKTAVSPQARNYGQDRPKLERFTGVIDRILESDLSVPRKQRHTAKRIFERLPQTRARAGPRRCSFPCPTPRGTPSATLARPW